MHVIAFNCHLQIPSTTSAVFILSVCSAWKWTIIKWSTWKWTLYNGPKVPHIRFYLFIAEKALSLVAFLTSITNTGFESEGVTSWGNNKIETNFFKTFLEFSKVFQSRVSKHCIQFPLAVKNLVCVIYFKNLLEISARLIQIEQVLQIGATLLQIEVPLFDRNRGNSYYKSRQFQLLQIGAELLQIGAGIINWGNYYKLVENHI